jgi:hypothetical protein
VFLAGDAVHQLSPTGALGMNSGVGDAVDLGWKLSAVLQGWGGARLLDSYEIERRPVGERNVRMATGFFMNNEAFRGSETLEEDSGAGARSRLEFGEKLVREIGREFRTIGLQIGYRYDPSPICVPDGTPAPADDPETYVPSARPGARAPHVWLRDGRSILDLYGRGFVLIRTSGAAPGVEPLEQAARRRSVPLEVITLDDPEVETLYERRLVLVRPDGHVAWRADEPPADPLGLIDRVRGNYPATPVQL